MRSIFVDLIGEEPAERFSIDIVPAEVEPGGILKIALSSTRDETFSAEESPGGHELIFQHGGNRSNLLSIAGVDLEVPPGTIDLTVYVRTRDGDADIIRSQVIRQR